MHHLLRQGPPKLLPAAASLGASVLLNSLYEAEGSAEESCAVSASTLDTTCCRTAART